MVFHGIPFRLSGTTCISCNTYITYLALFTICFEPGSPSVFMCGVQRSLGKIVRAEEGEPGNEATNREKDRER